MSTSLFSALASALACHEIEQKLALTAAIEADWRAGAWNLRGSAMRLKARREGSADTTLNGQRPTNVPASSLKAQAAYNVPSLPGLAVLGFVTREGDRMVLRHD